MDAIYYQCCSARVTGFKDTLVSATTDETCGKRVISQSPGTLDDHGGIEHTFRGSWVLKENCTVNQSITFSFDPSSLTRLLW
jgi:hypothetical protein